MTQANVNISLTAEEAQTQILQNEQMLEVLKNEATQCGDFARISKIVHVVEPLESTMNKIKTALMMSGGVTIVPAEPEPTADK